MIDTGIWPEHPMFKDPAAQARPAALGLRVRRRARGLGAAFTCNDKLIGAYAFLATNLLRRTASAPASTASPPMRCSARDSDGHGTHTATTAAGN